VLTKVYAKKYPTAFGSRRGFLDGSEANVVCPDYIHTTHAIEHTFFRWQVTHLLPPTGGVM